MTTFTSVFGLAKPVVGVTRDTWGNNGWTTPGDPVVGLNDNFSIIDYHMFSRKTGGTIDGPVTLDGGIDGGVTVSNGAVTVNRVGDTSAAYMVILGDAGFQRGLRINDDSATTRTILGVESTGTLFFGNNSFNTTEVISSSSGNIVFKFNNTERARIEASGVTKLGIAGTVAAPVLQFGGLTTGFYLDGSSRVSISDGGTKVAGFEGTGTGITATTTVVTREKGDWRYVMVDDTLTTLLDALNASGALTNDDVNAILATAGR